MEIRRFVSDLLQSNMYLVVEGNRALVIDPCRDISPATGLRVDMILLTHEHYDHISGVASWQEAYQAPVVCSTACAANIQDGRKNMAMYFDAFCEMQSWIDLKQMPDADQGYTCHADETFTDRTIRTWAGHTLEMMELPAHSQGSIGILLDGAHFFSGDSIMRDHRIELRFPGGNRAAWRQFSLFRIAALPRDIKIWPGHFDGFLWEQRVEKWKAENGVF